MAIYRSDLSEAFEKYRNARSLAPVFFCGDAAEVLRSLPGDSFDFCMTSPPYWGKRQYHNGGIGLEEHHTEFIDRLLSVFAEVKRVLKPTGSFWLNIGDSYADKQLIGIPWRLALGMTDRQGWTLRNSVIWNKIKGGPDNSSDRLRNVYENLFHFVKTPRGYYFDADAIRSNPKKTRIVNGAIVSATGVSGVRYKRQIELTTALTEREKESAFAALDARLEQLNQGELADFRMIIRNQQRATHSDSETVSGRAREIRERGFYFLNYHRNGSKPSDVWDILPEDTQKRADHFAPYQEDLCKIPLLATCPPSGLVFDPFCGTGTTMFVARNLGRRSLGIDIAEHYLNAAEERCACLL